MTETAKKVRGFWEDMPERGILAHMEYFKSISEAFTKSLDTYLKRHSDSQDKWLKDFPSNASKAGEELLKSLFKAPQKALDKYFEKETDGNVPPPKSPPAKRDTQG